MSDEELESLADDCPCDEDFRVFLCAVCGKNAVDALNGYDTCQECLDRQ